MIRLIRPAAILLLVALAVLPAAADKAYSFYKKGQDQEARQNYEQAYDYYKQAYNLKSKDLRYRAAVQRLSFLAGASHVHRGQLLRDTGRLEEALGEFQKAAQIDPTSDIARQEIRRTQQMIQSAQSPSPQSAAPPPSGLEKRLEGLGAPVDLAPISVVPITLKLTEDSKVIYETVGKLAGINVLFDPDYTSRRIKIELNGVTLEEALEIVALESKTFWRPVTPNTIFIAQDSQAKRKEVEQSVIKTFYLSNLSQQTELQDVVNTLRQILEISRIQPLPSQSAIVVRATPDQLALAGKLIDDLDKSKPEVIIDVAIMQVSRDKLRNLGITPPTSTSIALQPNTSSSGSSGSGGLSLNQLPNLNATNFIVTIPSASAAFSYGDSTVRLIQNPQIRSVDGQKASLKIGERLPVATGSFQPGIGGVGINPLVNTQFQYLDVGVNIDVTPKVHVGREVTLKISLDVSSQTGTVSIGGISQPVIGQRKIEHEIRLKEGESSLLGGMLENQDTRSLSGIPGLAQIPILKYLFGSTNTEQREAETVFVMTPHIVRAPDLSDLNEKAIEIGTASTIDLRRATRPVTPPAGGEGKGPGPTGTQVPAQPPTATQAQMQTPSPAAPAPPPVTASFAFEPVSVTQPKGATFTVNIVLSRAQNVYSVPLQISYDPKVLQVVNVSNGGFLSQDGQAVALVHRDDDSTGTLQVTATRPPGAPGISGQGAVLTLTFMAKASGQSTLTISKGGARDPNMQALPVAGAVAAVTVQ
jgi:general secretion pathway protein D